MTIYDIAKAAGVSASTVSRIVNKKDNVRKETRQKVEALLKEYNYIPNENARGLVNQASKIIGILIMDIRTSHYTDGIFYIERELKKHGYCCIIMNTGMEETAKAENICMISRRRVEGVILIGSSFQSEAVKQAICEYLSNIPVVIVNGTIDLPNVYGVMADKLEGIARCVELLISKGRRNLAFMIHYPTPSNQLKLDGYKNAIQRYCPDNPPVVAECDTSIESAYQVTKELIRRYPQTDGIIYAVDLLAIGGVRALLDMNKSVPEDVSVIGVNNSLYAEICSPRLSSLDNQQYDLSMMAVQSLINALRGEYVAHSVMIPSTIKERETT